jgi:hypothetical protein
MASVPAIGQARFVATTTTLWARLQTRLDRAALRRQSSAIGGYWRPTHTNLGGSPSARPGHPLDVNPGVGMKATVAIPLTSLVARC